VENAFLANPEIVSDKNILLVDDIATTCSTINECSNALRLAGAKNIYVVTLARAILDQDTAEQLQSLGYYPNTNISTISGG
jgi:phosphoribosylpyrophosphate synthetase